MLDSSRDGLGRWRFRLPAPSSNRLWRFGKARRPTCWRHSKLWFIEPGATGLRAVANTMPRWKEHEHDNKYPATDPDSAFRKAVSAGFLKPRLSFSPGVVISRHRDAADYRAQTIHSRQRPGPDGDSELEMRRKQVIDRQNRLARIYLIRHGETEWSLSGRHTSRTDIPLTARGEDGARELGQRFRNIQFPRVLRTGRGTWTA